MSTREKSDESAVSPRQGRVTRRGTVDETTNGRFRVRYRTPDGKRRSKTYDTQAEAEMMRKGCELLYGGSASLTLDGYAEGWFEARELSRAYRSVDHERVTWRTHIEGTEVGTMPLKNLARRDVKAWLDALKAKKARLTQRGSTEVRFSDRYIARSTIESALVLLRCILEGALEAELIPVNPARGVKVGRRIASTSEGWTFLTAKEIDQVQTSPAIPSPERTIFVTAIFSGLREGELWGLRWEDVDLSERFELVVRFSHQGPTKSGKVRRVPLLGPARAALEAWKPVCPANRLGLVFPGPRGGQRAEDTDARWSDQHIPRSRQKPGGPIVRPGYKNLIGITRRVRFHDLRHTCASHLAMGTWGRSWRLEEIRDFLGHSSITTTQRYAHLSPEHLHRAASETTGAGSWLGLGENQEAPKALVLPTFLTIPASDTGRCEITSGLEGLRDLAADYDPAKTQQAAKALLLAAAEGEAVPQALIDELVDAVLGGPMVRLALGAREPGPQRLMLALRLAAGVCEAFRAVTTLREGTSS